MSGLTIPIADSSDDTLRGMAGSVSVGAQEQFLPGDAFVSLERWLHSETVDELRL